jgi:glutamyl-tRNA synthetase
LGIATQADALLVQRIALLKDRCATLVELADWLGMYFLAAKPSAADLDQHVTDAVRPALLALADKFATTAWEKAAIQSAIKEVISAHALKMPQLAIPLRVLVCGRAQTPSVDAVLALFEKEVVIKRLRAV